MSQRAERTRSRKRRGDEGDEEVIPFEDHWGTEFS